MLAATRARPPATLVPHPGRNGFAASFATQRGRAFADDSLSTPGDGGGRWLAGALRRELTARRADVLTAVAPDRRRDAARPEAGREAFDDLDRARDPRCV